MRLLDIRCDGTRLTGPKKGARCSYLLFRIQPGLDGGVESKCPRCNKVRLWVWSDQLVGVST